LLSQNWAAVVAAGRLLGELDPDNPDTDGLVAKASAHLADADLVARRETGLRLLVDAKWQEVRDTFSAIQHDRPIGSFDAHDYKNRNVVERVFNHFKNWRGLASRYDKYALVYRGGVVLAAIVLWLS
jgi:hypothetical protein